MPNTHELVTYPNGSVSLKEIATGQTMHSWIGPWQEATLLYANQSQWDLRLAASSTELVIYDLGMGLATNALAAWEAWLAHGGPTRRPLRIVSFETAPEGLVLALNQREAFPFLTPERAEILDILLKNGRASAPGLSWELHIGDWNQLYAATPRPELIYFDMYAPSHCPDLWSERAFAELKAHADPTALLITYSSATWVRAAIALAGWNVGYGISTPLKSETTLASLDRQNLDRPLELRWLEQARRSAKLTSEDIRRLEALPTFNHVR